MAGTSRDKNGNVRITFTLPDGTRKVMRIGKADDETANVFKSNVQALLDAAATNSQVKPYIATWVQGLDLRYQRKLAQIGLIQLEGVPDEASQAEPKSVAELFDDFIENRQAKESTKTVWKQARRRLCEFLGPDKLANEVSLRDALSWREWMLSGGRPLAENTVRKTTQIARNQACNEIRTSCIESVRRRRSTSVSGRAGKRVC